MSLLKIQQQVSPYRGMPVDDTGSSSSVTSQTGETIQMYYNSSGTLTSDAGQAAGTIVMAKTTYNNVLNNLGDSLAKKGDTSLTFTSTALTAEVGITVVRPEIVESLDESDWQTRMAAIGALLSNGQYYVDYLKGVIYGKKTSTQSTLTSGAYKYQASAGAGSVSITAVVPGTGATSLGKAEDAAHTSGDTGVMALAVYKTTASQLAGTDGDYSTLVTGASGHLYTAEGFAAQAEDNTNSLIAMLPKAVAASTYSPSLFKNLGANATLNVKASTGNILSIYARNVSGADRWIQLHNTATTPTGGAVPVFSFYVPNGGVTERGTEFFTQAGVNGSNGWAFACSTTEGTYTAATATDHFTYIEFI